MNQVSTRALVQLPFNRRTHHQPNHHLLQLLVLLLLSRHDPRPKHQQLHRSQLLFWLQRTQRQAHPRHLLLLQHWLPWSAQRHRQHSHLQRIRPNHLLLLRLLYLLPDLLCPHQLPVCLFLPCLLFQHRHPVLLLLQVQHQFQLRLHRIIPQLRPHLLQQYKTASRQLRYKQSSRHRQQPSSPPHSNARALFVWLTVISKCQRAKLRLPLMEIPMVNT
mmetsp:Transcript_33625/g.81472  ORF Transcript_33625/g.81472 Transcript_33625/m.81472 type:complete len:218 (+) Transcript_33625:5270-5923(+)